MQDGAAKNAEAGSKTEESPAILQGFMELMTRFELVTSSLPRMRSTD